MIPSEFLIAYLQQYEVTPGELEVIAAVLDGKSLAEIALDLGIKTNAVRKRLGEVYYKFEIVGKGPGKLIKLQQRLISAYQAHTASKKVILVWSSEIGKLIAQGLKQTIFKHPQIEVSLSTQDLSAFSWRKEIEPWLDNVQLTICCLHNTTSAINFNLGWLVGKIPTQLLFQGTVPESLTDCASFNAQSTEDLGNVLESLIGKEEAQSWLNYQLLSWQNTLRTIEVHKTSLVEDRNWSQIAHSAQQAIAALTQNQYVTENGCFQSILLHSLAEINHQLKTHSAHLIPASLYPRYLNSLQRRSPITIKALTLVDREDFWQREMGQEIRSSTQPDSARVFVFSTPNLFERNFKILLEHAEKYAVRVVSYQKLAQDFPEYCQSFGIIAASEDKLLAKYVVKQGIKYNRFDAETKIIEQHEQILTNIINSAVEIRRTAHLSEPEAILAQMRQIRDLVFERSRFAVKSVGISQYLNIEHYDRWGQQQDFYPQLVQHMLALCSQHNTQRQSARILEVGAKTGHFTQYLTKFTADVWALELDWVCFKKLEYNLANYFPQITLEHKDSCAYDPPYQFDYIFSCLGDRQIEFSDKEKYFKNIKRNLRPNGLFIVGDEFLPPYDHQDPIARQAALKNYHNYRLSQTQPPELETLTQEITHCALNHQGDYKLSCDRYEELLRQTGFIFTKQQVNDSVYEQVGGVFVYKAWLNSEQ